MNFTRQEKEELEKLAVKHKVVAKAIKELNGYLNDDPTKQLFLTIKELVDTLSSDAVHLLHGREESCKILSNDKDDKLFERIDKLIVNSAKYFEAIQKGKECIDPETVKMASNNEKVVLKLGLKQTPDSNPKKEKFLN